MKNLLRLFSLIVVLASCNGNSSQNKLDSTLSDSSTVVKNTQPKHNLDSLAIDIAQSKFNCTRSKTVKNVDKMVKLFGANVNVKMDNASFSSDFSIKILNGSWFSLDKIFDKGKIVLDMKSISSVQVGKNNELEMTSPDYLDVKEYPTAALTIYNFSPDANHPQRFLVNAHLQLKDTLGEIQFPAELEYGSDKLFPSKLIGDFHIDGIKWGLNRKNATVLKDDLLFHVELVTDKK